MVKIVARNLRLKKEEEMKNPKLKVFNVKGKPRYSVTGVGSDGTKMFKFISKDDYDKYKAEGLSSAGGSHYGGKRSKSRSKKSKSSKRSKRSKRSKH
jgi:hypothetical protein